MIQIQNLAFTFCLSSVRFAQVTPLEDVLVNNRVVAEQRLTPLFARGSPRFHNRSFPRLTTFINGAPSSHHPQTTFINGLNPRHPSHCLGKGRRPKKSHLLSSFPPAQKPRQGAPLYIVTIEKAL